MEFLLDDDDDEEIEGLLFLDAAFLALPRDEEVDVLSIDRLLFVRRLTGLLDPVLEEE